MPSEKSLIGRSRLKIRALQGIRSRMINFDPELGCSGENPAVGSYPRSQAIMAAMPQPYWQESRCGHTRHSLVKMWARKHFLALLLTLCVLMLLCYYLSPGNYNLRSDENTNGQSLEKTSTWKALLIFFFPTTCIPKENQEVKACNNGGDLKESECLEYKCCYSSLRTSNFSCFAPFKDKPTQVFRMFGFGVISMIFVGYLPIYCCGLCQRSKWANPLRRRINRILRRKQRNKLKGDAEMLGAAMQDEEELSERKEEEATGLLFK